MTEADRNVNNQGPVICDSNMGGKWYRFEGAAGTKMPTWVPPYYGCGTHAPGWLNGGYPSVNDGQVTRTVCFNWSGNNCMWSASVQVRNCGAYYVFQLPNAPACNLRYCGE
ncbi:MAG: hypothetical protein HY744_29600 [Deltaproteobacteria bacterium]|nr:hypothetical protein [Deltaproteobacteria bacterium]